MTMNDREKLTALVKSTPYGVFGTTLGENFTEAFAESIAKHLIANGVNIGVVTNDDLISRTALLEDIAERRRIRRLSTPDHYFTVSDAIACINSAPAVNRVEEKPRRGRWIVHSHGIGLAMTHYAECSECHTCGSPHWKVCPACETKMDLGVTK